MIDEKKLIENILYSDKWNNAPCPMWVIRMIVADSKKDTPEKSLNTDDVIRYTAQLFGSPCGYVRGTIDVGDEMKQRYPHWCNSNCTKHADIECWQKYFEMRKEEEGEWEK